MGPGEPAEGTCRVVHLDGHTVALYRHGGKVYAVDNRCPHMGFPLDRGTVRDGILTCHWHHARFDLATGGTFDLFADDVPSFPVQVREDGVYVDVTPRRDPQTYYVRRLNDGLKHELPLVIAKSVIALDDANRAEGLKQTFAVGLDFGTRYRRNGWGQGLTMLTCFQNLVPHLDAADRPQALYQGLSAVARDTEGMPPRFIIEALPGSAPDFLTLKRWFRNFVEVRDGEGAERCIVTAVRAGMSDAQLAEMFFAAATDHRYIQIGHVADFTNKALEALDLVGADGERAEWVLSSLASGYVNATRQEESNAWRNPIDLVEILEAAFERLQGGEWRGERRDSSKERRAELVAVLLGDEPQAIADALTEALRGGASEAALAGTVAYAAALRIARFHTSNEFGDWDTALHTFTFANALHQGIRRVVKEETPLETRVELLRGVFDAAMSVYLDRFLNIPPARIPEVVSPNGHAPAADELASLLDRQQQVNQAAVLVAEYFGANGNAAPLRAILGRLLLREDRDFHTIQTMEAAFRQSELLEGTEARNVLIAAARYLAAHAPTVRAEGQTYHIARRLDRGEKLFEEE
jgi:nitrite reductase/ring-hydroxylating ferredoxin subunit